MRYFNPATFCVAMMLAFYVQPTESFPLGINGVQRARSGLKKLNGKKAARILSDTQNVRFLAEYFMAWGTEDRKNRSTSDQRNAADRRKVCVNWGLNAEAGFRIAQKARDEGIVHRKKGSGRKTNFTDVHFKAIGNYIHEKNGDLTYQELTDWWNAHKAAEFAVGGKPLTMSYGTMRKIVRTALNTRNVYKYTRPFLTADHIASRQAWAHELLGDDEEFEVGVAEVVAAVTTTFGLTNAAAQEAPGKTHLKKKQ